MIHCKVVASVTCLPLTSKQAKEELAEDLGKVYQSKAASGFIFKKKNQ